MVAPSAPEASFFRSSLESSVRTRSEDLQRGSDGVASTWIVPESRKWFQENPKWFGRFNQALNEVVMLGEWHGNNPLGVRPFRSSQPVRAGTINPPTGRTTMSRRHLLYAAPLAALVVAIGLYLAPAGQSAPSPAAPGQEKVAQLKPAVSLPISQVILFNSGVGHFTRSGEVEGDARVDLTFPEQDINDLIKSMTLRDLSPNGRVAARHLRFARSDRPHAGVVRDQLEQLARAWPRF